MDFSVFNLICARGANADPAALLSETITETRIADELGYSTAWFAEHHFSRYGLCASPLLLISHCASLTRHIRLAPGVLVLPLYNPMRLISEIIIADTVSNGRLTIGVGAGYQPLEFERFSVAFDDRFSIMNESLDIIDLALSRSSFAYKDKHHCIPETVLPVKPLQCRIPVFVAGHSYEMFRLAAKRRCGVLTSGTVYGVDYLANQYRTLQNAFAAEAVDLSQAQIVLNRFCCITKSREDGLRFAENARYQSRLGRRNSGAGNALDSEQPFENEPSLEVIHDNLLIGDVETVAEKLVGEIAASRASDFCFSFKIGVIEHRTAIRSMELMMTEVKPRVERAQCCA